MAVLLDIAGGSFGGALSLGSGWFPPKCRGLAMGIAGAGNSGTVMAVLFAPPLAVKYGGTTTPMPGCAFGLAARRPRSQANVALPLCLNSRGGRAGRSPARGGVPSSSARQEQQPEHQQRIQHLRHAEPDLPQREQVARGGRRAAKRVAQRAGARHQARAPAPVLSPSRSAAPGRVRLLSARCDRARSAHRAASAGAASGRAGIVAFDTARSCRKAIDRSAACKA